MIDERVSVNASLSTDLATQVAKSVVSCCSGWLKSEFMDPILIAEDEVRLSAFLAKGLRQQGYSVTIAEDGEQAIALLERENFSLLVLDIGLPIKDGWAVLQELRQKEISIPVIIVTALSDNGHQDLALSLGASDFLMKPFRFSVLLARVRSHLNDMT